MFSTVCRADEGSEMRFCFDIVNPISGGYSGGVPPLPIPNREVKPARADGTAMQCGRVGSRLLYGAPEDRDVPRGLFFVAGHAIVQGRQ